MEKYKLTIKTIMDTAILKVNNTSNTKGGKGNTIIARIIMINTGPANVLRLLASIKPDNVAVLFIFITSDAI